MNDIVDVFKELGEVAYWTGTPAAEEEGGNLSCPPIVVWRYEEPSPELASMVLRMVKSFQGRMTWAVSTDGQAWSLMPARVRELADSQKGLGTYGAAGKLTEIDPDFGKRANEELILLAEHIRCHLGRDVQEQAAAEIAEHS